MWIAFIFQYLWDTKQQRRDKYYYSVRCELLSFFSIFGIQNNGTYKVYKVFRVVNCFHFSVSLGYKTTEEYLSNMLWMLWIAFIFQYLWDTKQQDFLSHSSHWCCELLSFFSIFGIQNNISLARKMQEGVVNCFHFSVSLGYKTT